VARLFLFDVGPSQSNTISSQVGNLSERSHVFGTDPKSKTMSYRNKSALIKMKGTAARIQLRREKVQRLIEEHIDLTRLAGCSRTAFLNPRSVGTGGCGPDFRTSLVNIAFE
jgi:hypothetical protein